MTARSVAELLAELAEVVRRHQFGLIELSGVLTDWRTHRSGFATGELTSGGQQARLRVVAGRYAAASVHGELAEAGRSASAPGAVVAYGHLVIDPRWGIQLELLRLHCTGADAPNQASVARANQALTWPTMVTATRPRSDGHG